MRNYFCGWYFKCQSGGQTIALIAARHRSRGVENCSVQIITDDGAWRAIYPIDDFSHDGRRFETRIGESRFGKNCVTLSIHEKDLDAVGSVTFGEFSPIKGDIMGPFRFLPFMQCRHSVVSMRHTVNGTITVNGKRFVFENGEGYVEGDRGSSFPRVYLWTHAFIPGGSLMLSAAEIPVGPVRFTGIIGVLYKDGKEERIATYRGARAATIKDGGIVVTQGGVRLTARLIEKRSHPLYAPQDGSMTRTVRESASCRAFYEFVKGDKTLISSERPDASFEYEYPE